MSNHNHTNQIAIKILSDAYADYPANAYHYDREYDMIIKAIEMTNVTELLQTLQKIANWELPESGAFWDTEKTRPMIYEAAYGSRGAIDYFMSLATTAICNTTKI